MTFFRWAAPGARGKRGSHCASAEEARSAAVRHVAADADSSPELTAQIWRSLRNSGWKIEEVGPTGLHVGWALETAR